MQTLTLCLIRRYDEDLGPLQYAHHLQGDLIVPISEGVDPVVQQEFLISNTQITRLLFYTENDSYGKMECSQKIFDEYGDWNKLQCKVHDVMRGRRIEREVESWRRVSCRVQSKLLCNG